MKKSILATAVIAAALATQAQAEGFYVFGEYSYSDIASSDAEGHINSIIDSTQANTDERNDLGGDIDYAPNFDSDDTDHGFGIGLGYSFNESFSSELSYKDIGSANYSTNGSLTGTDFDGTALNAYGNGTNSYESEAVIIRGVGILPVTQALSFELLLGLAYVDTSYTSSMNAGGAGNIVATDQTTSGSGSDFSATYGIGASYQFTPELDAYARWERIHDIDTENAWGGIEADSLTAGMRYHF